MRINVPGLWFMSWYDVSVGPNLATYNHVRKTARPEIANQQYAVIAPTLHCSYKRATENTDAFIQDIRQRVVGLNLDGRLSSVQECDPRRVRKPDRTWHHHENLQRNAPGRKRSVTPLYPPK